MPSDLALEITPESKAYKPLGSAKELFYSKDTELLFVGAAGTGKSRGALEKVHLILLKYPKSRGLLVRKTRESLTHTTLRTFEDFVVPDGFFGDGPARSHRQSYEYPNGSELVLAGMDKPSRILSSEYDVLMVDEAIEIEEEDWETLLSRLRNNKVPYQQAIACTNPSYPAHWLYQRYKSGRMKLLNSTHADNPSVTQEYLAILDRLTGTRRQRLRDGLWCASSGLVYDTFDPKVHVIHWNCSPKDFTQLFASIDWGFVHAGVLQVWGLDEDGRLYLLKEIVQTRKSIDWWIIKATSIQQQYGVEHFVCDSARPDYIDQLRGHGLNAINAYKSVSIGIQAVQERLKVQADGKPRLMLLDDALEEKDVELVDAKKPWSLEQEMQQYQWDKTGKDQPLKENDNSSDACRYAVSYADGLGMSGVELA